MPSAPYPGKRAVDLLFLVLFAVPAIAAGAVCAVAIKATSRGPVFYRQPRLGKDGRLFEIWKFRTMVNAPDNPLFPDPQRITPAGRWLRRLSLDELPQLINIARGEMSVVGPRPGPAFHLERYDRGQRGRLAVRPGLTGLAQVSGRNTLSWRERIEYDLDYVRNQSALLDIAIVMKTFATVLRGTGVAGHPKDDPLAAGPTAKG